MLKRTGKGGPAIIAGVPGQGLLQLKAWVSANGVLKDYMINVYL